MSLIRTGFLAVLLSAIAVTPVTADDNPPVLEAASDWVLDYADDSCALRRAFGDPERPVVLEMRQHVSGPNMRLMIFGQSLENTGDAGEFRLAPGSDWLTIPYVTFLRMADGGEGVQFFASLLPAETQLASIDEFFVNPEHREREAAIRRLETRGFFENDVVLQVGPLDQAMLAMRSCTDDLMTQWGIDPERYRENTRPPEPINQMGWTRQIVRAYPAEMLRAGQEGRVDVLLVVGNDGRVDRCVVTASTANVGLQESACEDLQRYARFEPALDGDGEPTRGFWSTRVIYDI